MPSARNAAVAQIWRAAGANATTCAVVRPPIVMLCQNVTQFSFGIPLAYVPAPALADDPERVDFA
jgi:hypothetical protein